MQFDPVDLGDMIVTKYVADQSGVVVKWENKQTGFVFYTMGNTMLADQCSYERVKSSNDTLMEISNKIAEATDYKERVKDKIKKAIEKKQKGKDVPVGQPIGPAVKSI